MKVGLISFNSFLYPGGVKRHILELKDELKKRGLEVKVIVPRRKASENYGKDVILLGTSFSLSLGGTQGDFDVNFNPLAIDKVLKKEKFDVLHFHSFGFPSAFQILERSKALNILTFHPDIERIKLFKFFPVLISMLNTMVQWKMDGIIGVNPLNLKVFKGYKKPMAVIPNGIDLNKFHPGISNLKQFANEKINILFLGRLEERKGLIYLLRAYKILDKKHDNLRLIVVGDGPLKRELKEWTRKNKLRNVVFEGGAEEKDTPSYYKTADIFCSPAIYGESFGIVLVEAMAVGKPVVAFANKGYRVVLGKGKGKRFLAEPKDYKNLAERLETLINNENLRKEMGEWGVEESKKYAWPNITDQVLAFYKLCSEKKKQNLKPFKLRSFFGIF